MNIYDIQFVNELKQRIRNLPLKEKLKVLALHYLYEQRKQQDEILEKKIKDAALEHEQLSMPFYERVLNFF